MEYIQRLCSEKTQYMLLISNTLSNSFSNDRLPHALGVLIKGWAILWEMEVNHFGSVATFTSELFLQHVSLYAAAELQSRFFILLDLSLDTCINNADEKALLRPD